MTVIKKETGEDYIESSNFDPDFKSEVIKQGGTEGLNDCFACGTCTAGCPIHELFPEYDPRKLAKMIKLGMKEEVLSSPYIWYCTTCRNCEQRCPQNVKFYNILNVLKNMAAKKGYASSSWIEQTHQVVKTGLVFSIEDSLAQKRRALSLPDLKQDGTKAKKVIESTGIDKIKARKKK